MFLLVRLVLYGFLLYDICISRADDVSSISTLSNRKTFLFTPCYPALFNQNSTSGNTNSSQQRIPVDIEIYGNFTDFQIKPTKPYIDPLDCGSKGILYPKSFFFPLRLFANRSLLTNDLLEIFNSDPYCVDEITNHSIIFKYCFNDPCIGQKKCIKKCCPPQFSFHVEQQSCKRDSQPRNITLNGHNQYVPGDISQFTIHHFFIPSTSLCIEERLLLDPSQNIEDEFQILPDGKLFSPGVSPVARRTTSYYCIDNFIVNDTISTKAFRCLSTLNEQRDCILKGVRCSSKDNTTYLHFIGSYYLTGTLIVYCIVPELRRKVFGKTLICYVLSLIVTFVQIGIIQLNGSTMKHYWCRASAIILHFFFLSSFTWLNVMGFDMWRKITSTNITNGITIRKDSKRLKFGLYSLYAWGVPSLFVITGAVLSLQTNPPENLINPKFGLLGCWFYGFQEKLVYIYVPITLVLVVNIFFFISTVIYIRRITKAIDSETRNTRTNLQKQRLNAMVRLFILTGIPRIFQDSSWIIDEPTYDSMISNVYSFSLSITIFGEYVLKRPILSSLARILLPILRLPLQKLYGR